MLQFGLFVYFHFLLHGKRNIFHYSTFRLKFFFFSKNLRKGDTRLHYIGFYTIYYIENISFSIIYAIHSAETNSILKYSLVTFVCVGFWLAILFQFVYYRFLHPSDHVRLSTKANLASIARCRFFSSLKRLKRSKSFEEMIQHSDYQSPTDGCETISLPSNQNAVNERWFNRFSKENRQILISQQQAIDQKVKLTRAQRQTVKFLDKVNSIEVLFFSGRIREKFDAKIVEIVEIHSTINKYRQSNE